MGGRTDATPGPGAKDAMAAFAAKADDLDEIKRSVNDAASTSGALWISYLFVLFYTAIAAGAVTPVDLFMENPVKLPFLSIDLPLKAFFFLAPVLFLITHVYTLMSFVILSDKAKWYHRELRRQIDAAGGGDPRAIQIRDDLRRHLVSNIFVQFLAGPGELRQGPFGLVLKSIVWTTLVFAPAALLLLVQVQFLPFHAQFITTTHRIVLLLDLVAVWWLWYRILAGRFSEEQTWRRWTAGLAQGAIVVASVLALVFSWTIATYPGEWQEAALPSLRIMPGGDRGRLSLHDYVFVGAINETTRRRGSFFTSTLILPGFNIYEQLKIDDPAKVEAQRAVFNARGRDFRGAIFDLSNLSQVDFEGANLKEAKFSLATLRATSFYCADVQRAVLDDAKLEGAWFHAADLAGVSMKAASGQAARFEGAVLTSANLEEASLQAATLDGADLRGANLKGSSLRGASLGSIKLEGHCVKPARSEAAALGATLANANLAGTDLEEAFLQGADLTEVLSMQGAKLGSADLSGATVSEVKLSGIDGGSIRRGMRLDRLKWESESMARSVATAGEAAAPVASPHETMLAHAAESSAYSTGLMQGLNELVCTGEPGSSFIGRGLVLNQRIAKMGESTPDLVDAMLTGPCATDLALPGDMKADLVALKRASLKSEAR